PFMILLSIIMIFLSNSIDSECPLRDVISFPTRRSSDLVRVLELGSDGNPMCGLTTGKSLGHIDRVIDQRHLFVRDLVLELVPVRSEEHTSELQSREKLVCRLLLEHKKNI